MAKLFFRYAAMYAGKTLDLLKVAYNYSDRGYNVMVLTSNIDTRAGNNRVYSRAGFDRVALSIGHSDNIFNIIQNKHQELMMHQQNIDNTNNLDNSLVQHKTSNHGLSCVLIDEVQFLTIEQIDQLSDIVDYLSIPVIAYGLRTDYCGNPFPSSAKLLAIADSIEELKTICFCGRKATHNMLIKNNLVIKDGNSILADDDKLKNNHTKYCSVCRLHWKNAAFQHEN